MKCAAATWCIALPTPNTSYCRLHVKFPLRHSLESQHDWLIRVRREMKKAERAAAAAAASDKKLAERRT